MSTKSVWTDVPQEQMMSALVRPWCALEREKDSDRRVTVSAWPCPETIARSELAKMLKAGCEIKDAGGRECLVVDVSEKHQGSVLSYAYLPCKKYDDTGLGKHLLTHITAIRCPGDDDSRPWTKVVEG